MKYIFFIPILINLVKGTQFLSPNNYPICSSETNPFVETFSNDYINNHIRKELVKYLIDDFQISVDGTHDENLAEYSDHRRFNIHPPIFSCPKQVYIGGENIEPGWS